MSIYKPTWLYIKQHNQTGLKYFGKTYLDPYSYNGSGLYWKRHLKIHGKDISTTWAKRFDVKEELMTYAIAFSRENNIVESVEWANLAEETGLDGGWGRSAETRKKITEANKRRGPMSDEQKAKISLAMKGKTRSPEHCQKLSDSNKGKAKPPQTKEANLKRSLTLTGRTYPNRKRPTHQD